MDPTFAFAGQGASLTLLSLVFLVNPSLRTLAGENCQEKNRKRKKVSGYKTLP